MILKCIDITLKHQQSSQGEKIWYGTNRPRDCTTQNRRHIQIKLSMGKMCASQITFMTVCLYRCYDQAYTMWPPCTKQQTGKKPIRKIPGSSMTLAQLELMLCINPMAQSQLIFPVQCQELPCTPRSSYSFFNCYV